MTISLRVLFLEARAPGAGQEGAGSVGRVSAVVSHGPPPPRRSVSPVSSSRSASSAASFSQRLKRSRASTQKNEKEERAEGRRGRPSQSRACSRWSERTLDSQQQQQRLERRRRRGTVARQKERKAKWERGELLKRDSTRRCATRAREEGLSTPRPRRHPLPRPPLCAATRQASVDGRERGRGKEATKETRKRRGAETHRSPSRGRRGPREPVDDDDDVPDEEVQVEVSGWEARRDEEAARARGEGERRRSRGASRGAQVEAWGERRGER